jgi:predicted  nucleic acid-binding Zn-ribbon protein
LAAQKEVARLAETLEKEMALKHLAEAKTRMLRERVLETIETLDAKSRRAVGTLEKLATETDAGVEAFDKKFEAIEKDIGAFCEQKGSIVSSTEKDLEKWTGEIARVSQAAMDKANGAVNMLVRTIKMLKENEAQLSAAEEELDIAKADLRKASAELVGTTQELVKTKANLEESRERADALETSTSEMSARLKASLATVATTTMDRNRERSGRLQANLAKSIFRMLKNKFQADAENAADALVDAEEALEAAKTSRAIAHVNAAQAKIRLALLRNGKLHGGPPREPVDERPPSFVSDDKIMGGTPADLAPYQKMLTREYHAASVALQTGHGGENPE